jgi:hypothetical protein
VAFETGEQNVMQVQVFGCKLVEELNIGFDGISNNLST